MSSYPVNIASAVRGPLVLITVGILFALDQTYSLPFSRTWPILIIVVGVMKLVERAFFPAPVQPTYVPPPPASGGTPPYAGGTQPYTGGTPQ